jgi:flagellar protein FlgJ
MTSIGANRAATSAVPTPDAERQRLQSAIRDLQGVFVEQLFKAMRETVPQDGIVSGGSGEEMFQGLLDARLASLVPDAWQGSGLEAALSRQLRLPTTSTGQVPASPLPPTARDDA